MRHFNMFTLVLVSMFIVSGCYMSHERPSFVTPAPDAGSVTADGGPVGGVTLVCGRPSMTGDRLEVTTGTRAELFGMRITPNSRPVAIARAEFTFGVSSRSLFGRINDYDSGEPYFTDWQLAADSPYRVFNAHPPDSIVPDADGFHGRVSIDGLLDAVISTPTYVALRAQIVATDNPMARALTTVEYSAVIGALRLVYTDTGETVPVSDLTLEGCGGTSESLTLVRLAQADLAVDRVGGDPSSTVREVVGRTVFLRLAALNDGASDGTLGRMVFDTRAIIIPASGPTRPASVHDAVSACYAVRDGVVLATARIEGEQIVFDHAGVIVTTVDRGGFAGFAYFNVECDVHLNDAILPLYGAMRVWLGADAITGFTVEEAPPARVWGTLVLQQNTHPSIPDDSTMYVQIIR